MDHNRSPDWLSDPFLGFASSSHSSSVVVRVISPNICESSCARVRGLEDVAERCRRNRRRSRSRVLQSPFPCGKSNWGMETGDRPFPPERVCSSDSVQDGDSGVSPVVHSGRRFPSLDRPEGRVFSDTRPQVVEEVFTVPFWGGSVSVQSSVLRTVHGPSGVYPRVWTDLCLGSRPWDPSSQVSGRLADSRLLGGRTQTARLDAHLTLQRSRDHCKRGEVGSRAQAESLLPGHDDRHRSRQDFSIRVSGEELLVDGIGVPLGVGTSSTPVASRSWPLSVVGKTRARRSSSDALTPVVSQNPLESGDGSSITTGTLVTGGEGGPDLVADRGAPSCGGAVELPTPRLASVHRRVSAGVGSSSPRSVRVGYLDRGGESRTHQPSRVEGSVLSSSSVPTPSSRSVGGSDVRQLHGGSLRQQTGGHCVPQPLLVDEAASVLGRSKHREVACQVSTWQGQCLGGSAQSKGSGNRFRVVSPSRGGETGLLAPRDTYTGPICDQVEQEASALLFTGPRPHGCDGGCFHAPLGSPRGVCVSPIRPDSSSHKPTKIGVQLQDDPCISAVAPSGVVSGPVNPPGGAASRVASVASATEATPLLNVPPRRPRAEPSRLAVIQRVVRAKGFSRRAAAEIAHSVRRSTSRVYQGKWAIFCGWCRRRNLHPQSAPVQRIADFFVHLRRDKGLSVSAIKGYRAALNQVYALKGQDLAQSKELSLLFRSFSISCPPAETRPPQWDVSLVLRSLRTAPYEPLRDASERHVAQKALFLLALASSKRIGELHGLSFRVSHTQGWKSMSFSFVPGFVAKTQDPSISDPRFESFTIPALPRRDSDPDARLLCPVRAVRRYLDLTAIHRPDRNRLFISPGATRKEVSKNTISFWLRQVISRAHSEAGEPVPRPRARETRGIGPSLLFKSNFAVESVLKAGTWKRHSTFTRFYLRDLASRTLDTFHLGPVVAAQAII